MSGRMSRVEMERAAVEAEVWPPIMAIDPGSAHTGICLRVGQQAIEAVTVSRDGFDPDHRALVRWSRRNIEVAHEVISRNREQVATLALERGEPNPPRVRVAVETLVPPTARPTKHRQVAVSPTVLADLPGAAAVLGTVAEHWRSAIPVPPRGAPEGGWDDLPKSAYPANLKGHTPKGWLLPQEGTQDRSHQQSAWAIAGVAHALNVAQQQQASTAPAPEQPTRAEQVRQVVGRVIASRPDPADPAAMVATVRTAIGGTGASDLLGMEAKVAGAAAQGLGADPGVVRAAVAGWLANERTPA